jgi:pimeloyl-ACP methyl ester carboxylesterase
MSLCEVAQGVSLYYEDFGEGPAVVFTAAGSLTHKMWESQIAALAGEYRTVSYDWRGTGASDKPRSGYTPKILAADLCALIENLGLAPAVLVGHGIGTHVTLLAAANRPDLTRGIVLASGAPWYSGDHEGVTGGLSPDFIEFLKRTNELGDPRGVPYAAACAELAENWLFHRPQASAVHHAILEQALSWPQAVINMVARGMAGIDHRLRFRQIECPTLVIQGRYDRKQRYEGAVYLAQQIKNARLVTLENSAHMGQIEELNAFNLALSEFLKTVHRGQKRSLTDPVAAARPRAPDRRQRRAT